ncbi:hypothetical protein AHiyo6_23080 [Arthrobacter sp. Hiyo6]|nr:hypothetical protein AHiyo6_23080 [Arthrobacter sp. Hiyo6]
MSSETAANSTPAGAPADTACTTGVQPWAQRAVAVRSGRASVCSSPMSAAA